MNFGYINSYSTVGNGNSIQIMQDKWIPNHPTNRVLHQLVDEDGEGRVNELVDWIVHEWDRGFIGVKFTREDAEAMLHIPLSKRDILDSVV